MFKIIPKGFFPEQDTGRLMGAILADQDISFQAMHDRLVQMLKVIDGDPAVDNALAFTGGQDATNTARSFIALKPLSERKINAQQVIARIRKHASRIPGVGTARLRALVARFGSAHNPCNRRSNGSGPIPAI
jgi:multidrug efflux pump